MCDQIKQQGKSQEMVAAPFGVGAEGTDNDVESASAAASFYVKPLANEFCSPEFQQAWHQMEELLKAKVVVKSRMRSFGRFLGKSG